MPSAPRLSNVPVVITAKTRKALVEKMYANNLINGKGYNYMSPYKTDSGYEVWYYADVERDKHIDDIEFVEKSEVISGISS